MTKTLYEKILEYYEKRYHGAIIQEAYKILTQNNFIIMKKPLYIRVEKSQSPDSSTIYIIFVYEEHSIVIRVLADGSVVVIDN